MSEEQNSKKYLILTYHDIVAQSEQPEFYDVELNMFAAQMEYVKVFNANCSDMEIIITFDDGYKSWAGNVLDIISDKALKVYFFVCKKFLDNGLISKEDILSLKKKGVIIGSHSISHGFLHTMTEKEMFYELKASKDFLEELLDNEVTSFSVPRGIFNDRVIRTAKATGYMHLFTSSIGVNKGFGFLLRRVAIKRNTNMEGLKAITIGKGIREMAWRQRFLDAAKIGLGINNYNRIRSLLGIPVGD